DFMVVILLAATLIAGILGEYIDAIAILIIVLLNGCIGFFQERKAEKSLEKLKALSAPQMRVLRNKRWISIRAEDAVVGDIVQIKAGDRVPADIRLFQTNELAIDESILTGESMPVKKKEQAINKQNVEIHDQDNMCFKSTLVTKGNGLGIVVATGMKTAIGQVAALLEGTEEQLTPLQMKLVELSKVLIYVVLLLTVLTVMLGLFHGKPVYDMFLIGISLAVAVIPEGLPAIVTVTLSLGVQRMLKRKAIVRKLMAVETLGCTSVICTDKTGTITENRMSVQEIFLNEKSIQVTGEATSLHGKFFQGNRQISDTYPNVGLMLTYGMLCNEASLQVKQGRYLVNGDPTDGALLIAARKFGIDYDEHDKYKVIKQFPFDTLKKRMSTVIEDENGRRFLIVKGAPEVIIPRCSNELTAHGQISLYEHEKYVDQATKMANKALRVIAISMKALSASNTFDEEQLTKDLTFIGMYGLMDLPRKGVRKAIQACKDAGIQTIMMTGDHKATAKAIAAKIGLYESDKHIIMEGHELNHMKMSDLKNIVENVTVFARVTPAHKLKIVQALQEKDHIVAMTGDGINDAPAIKASNIGISMGITGTDVTKEASSFILMDDNFITLKEAIKEGRNIYENIRKFIRYLLASNVGEIFMMLIAMILALPLPLVPIQILWVNLITDGLPAMALGLDEPENNVMKEKPRHPKEGIFARGLGWKIISRGMFIGLVSLIAFMIAYEQSQDVTYARTIAFSTIVMAQLIHVFDCRSEQGIFSRNPFQNKYLNAAVVSSILLLCIVIYAPNLQGIFHTTDLTLKDWLFILSLSALPTFAFQLRPKKNADR
ncbi:MAG TPA: cation-translocating P-type ATPase, partial [Pseudogracilibacillus sp.]|nr:cation-translocating P-type ATPase [Pseudogracilibacillus sp.]